MEREQMWRSLIAGRRLFWFITAAPLEVAADVCLVSVLVAAASFDGVSVERPGWSGMLGCCHSRADDDGGHVHQI